MPVAVFIGRFLDGVVVLFLLYADHRTAHFKPMDWESETGKRQLRLAAIEQSNEHNLWQPLVRTRQNYVQLCLLTVPMGKIPSVERNESMVQE